MSRRMGRHAKRRNMKRILHVILFLLLLLLLAVPFIEPYTLTVQSTSLTSPALPAGMRPLRIVFVSDLHVRSWPFYTADRLNGLVKKINAQNPDLVLLGGDYAEDPEETEAFFRKLPAIHANYGIYAVLGEHDRPETQTGISQLRAAMVAKNVTPLINNVATVRIGTETDVQIVGLDSGDIRNSVLSTIVQTCQPENYVILVCHNPKLANTLTSIQGTNGARNWYDLAFFGHTHGGQLGFARGLLGLTESVPVAYTHGMMTEGRIVHIVSNGVGTSVVPIRLFCPPQIQVVTVRPAS